MIRLDAVRWISIFYLIVWIVLLSLGFNGLYGQDAHAYHQYTKELMGFFTSGESPGDFLWPVGYPLLAAIPGLLLGSKIGMILISFLSFLGCVYFIRKFLVSNYRHHVKRINLYLVLSLAFAPYFARGSLLAMSDMTACFFICGAVWHLYQYREKQHTRSFILAAFFSGAAFMVRYPSAVVLFPVIVTALPSFFKRINVKVVLGVLAAIVVCFLPHFLTKGSSATDFLFRPWLTGWSLENFVSTQFVTNDGIAENSVINLFYSLSSFVHPGYFLMGAPLLLFLRKKHFQGFRLILLIAALVYAFFLMGLPSQNMRYLLLSFPFIVIFFFPVFSDAYDYFRKRKWLINLGVVGIIVMQLGLSVYSFRSFYSRCKVEKEIAVKVKAVEKSYTKLYVFAFDPALKTYDVSLEMVNLWEQKIDHFERGALIIFNEPLLSKQWKGKHPMMNWENLNRKHELVILEELPEGWKLYEIQ